MAKEAYVLDLINGEYFGAETSSRVDDHGDTKITIRPMATGKASSFIPARRKEIEIPYNLDPEKHIYRFGPSQTGSDFPLVVLKPTSDMEGVAFEKTVWHQMVGDRDSRVSSLQDTVDRLKKEKRKLEKERDELLEEDKHREKEDRGSTGTSSTYECQHCGSRHGPDMWRSADFICPDCNGDNRYLREELGR